MRNPAVRILLFQALTSLSQNHMEAKPPEYTINNRENILKMAENFKGQKWGFMGLIYNMDSITDPKTSEEFAKYHSEFQKNGCVAIAFVVGRKVAIKAQAQRHHDISSAEQEVSNTTFSN